MDVIVFGLQESSYKEKKGKEDDKGDQNNSDEDEEDERPVSPVSPAEEAQASPTSPSKKAPASPKKVIDSITTIGKRTSGIILKKADSVKDVMVFPFLAQLQAHLGSAYKLQAKAELMEMRLFVFVHASHTVGLYLGPQSRITSINYTYCRNEGDCG